MKNNRALSFIIIFIIYTLSTLLGILLCDLLILSFWIELLMWRGIGIAAIALLEDKIYLILGAILNTLLFLFVSIPMADKETLNVEI